MTVPDHTMKRCTKCGQEFPRTNQYFYKNSYSKDGLQSRCRPCSYSEASFKEIPPDGYKICRICNTLYPTTLEYFTKDVSRKDGFDSRCKRCKNADERQWREDNPDRYSAARSKRYYKNPENTKRRASKWRKENSDRHNASNREWNRKHPDKRIADAHKRNAKKKHLVHDFTERQWKICLVYWNNSCAYCGTTNIKLTQEHFIPVNSGGGYTKTNIIPACEKCNYSKQNKDALTWLNQRYTTDQSNAIIQRIQEYFKWAEKEI